MCMSPFLNAGRALDQNFVFASLDNSEKQILTCAMETVMVKEGEELITQGRVTSSPFLSDLIYFYLILFIFILFDSIRLDLI